MSLAQGAIKTALNGTATVSASTGATHILIIACGILGIAFAAYQLWVISLIKLEVEDDQESLINGGGNLGKMNADIKNLYGLINDGAESFLFSEYKICMIFIVLMSALIFVLTALSGKSTSADGSWDWTAGAITTVSFAVGALTSIASGYIGMRVATYSNARTAIAACAPAPAKWTNSFNTAFRAGSVMGFSLCGLALIMLYVLVNVFAKVYDITDTDAVLKLMDCVAGFGLGGSSIAMFGRVGGGIYTKAADVGADLAGKVVEDLPEDDPRNPGTIADNVGDNVGDVAGMGSDLFGSFGEASCAALLVGASSAQIVAAGWPALVYPLVISAVGIPVCLITSFVATHLRPVITEKGARGVEMGLKVQLIVSTVLMTAAMYPTTIAFLPNNANGFGDSCTDGFFVSDRCTNATEAFACVCFGLWGGLLIGLITEYYTSHSYEPTREVARSCETGAATNIIYGLALGYKSVILPSFIIAATIFGAFTFAGMYGIALSAIGMIGTLATCLSIDVYGPVCDNAGGIAEMAHMPGHVRETTDALDAAGNTTAAIGKGFAIGSACLVGLALFGAFVTRVQANPENAKAVPQTIPTGKLSVNILSPITFAGLLIGAMLPYWFSAMTMKSVGEAANAMVKNIKMQFDGDREGIMSGRVRPDYNACITISTDASLREMIAPGALVMLSPVLVGTLFGVNSVCGLLAGAIVSGVQMAISASNTGGAWDNAKKYIGAASGDHEMIAMIKNAEANNPLVVDNNGVVVAHKKSEIYKAAVTGDTVGDPLKDTSGPALNIVMKLMAIVSVVFADYFCSINQGRGAFNIREA